ncbi:MAG TPA: hypothetical protein ENG63_07570 [Candidatus Desulfofervidus auxilii]|uniref:Uncharacterized protein n=1 Tax=Desulfofervidus auxilii TaxID=1621989 RepID=A0A7C0Y578_DESA2|nr:hypothetical protein [Candidatus Desulfofervidus auxilii]
MLRRKKEKKIMIALSEYELKQIIQNRISLTLKMKLTDKLYQLRDYDKDVENGKLYLIGDLK